MLENLQTDTKINARYATNFIVTVVSMCNFGSFVFIIYRQLMHSGGMWRQICTVQE